MLKGVLLGSVLALSGFMNWNIHSNLRAVIDVDPGFQVVQAEAEQAQQEGLADLEEALRDLEAEKAFIEEEEDERTKGLFLLEQMPGSTGMYQFRMDDLPKGGSLMIVLEGGSRMRGGSVLIMHIPDELPH